MTAIALVDNGSVLPAPHRLLRETAEALGHRIGRVVEAVSWRHSDRVPAGCLEPPAKTLGPWLRQRRLEGTDDFVLLPFVLSGGGAIASALRSDAEQAMAGHGQAGIRFAPGLAEAGVLPAILACRIRASITTLGLDRPPVVLVDHGGPAPASAALRDRVAAELAKMLAKEVDGVAAASMESPPGDAYAFNRPLFSEQLAAPGYAARTVMAVPLFLAPGRHAGPNGDLARIAQSAERKTPGLAVKFTDLVGGHPLVIEALAASLEALLTEGKVGRAAYP